MLRQRRTPVESIGEAFSYLRGWLTSFRFDRRALISSHGSTRVIKRNGRIVVGTRSRLWPGVKLVAIGDPNGPPAELIVGHHSSVGDNTQIHSGRLVRIGDHVLISWNVTILGKEYHAPGGGSDTPGSIIIEDHAWIGCGVHILKGVTIGRGAIVGAGSVVVKDVAAYTLVAGNPARLMRITTSWDGQ